MEVRELVEDIKSMYDSLRSGHDRTMVSFDNLADTAEWHAAEVVRIMREDRDAAAQRIRELDTALDVQES